MLQRCGVFGVQGDERLSTFEGPTAPRLPCGIGGMAIDVGGGLFPKRILLAMD